MMLRQKPANEAAVARLIDFTNDLWLTLTTDKIQKYNISDMIISHGVAKRSFSDLKALSIVKAEEGKKPQWIVKEQPSRTLALRILDYRLKKTKKTIHVPIPDFAGIADTLQTIGEHLEQLSVQNEKWLRTHKKGQMSNIEEADLFRIDDQRLFIAGNFASAVPFEKLIERYTDGYQVNKEIENFNDYVVFATNDLMNKLLKRTEEGKIKIQ